jgi:hypothetical protein
MNRLKPQIRQISGVNAVNVHSQVLGVRFRVSGVHIAGIRLEVLQIYQF